MNEAEQEQLYQRLEPIIKKFVVLRRDPTIGKILNEKAVAFQVEEWRKKAKIPEAELCKNSSLHTYLSEIYLFRSCYILLLIEDEIDRTELPPYLFCKAQHIFSSIIEKYAASINPQPKIKFTPSAVVVYNEKLFGSKPLEFKRSSLEDVLARNNKEQLYPTFRVRRAEEALNNVIAYLKQKGLLKDEKRQAGEQKKDTGTNSGTNIILSEKCLKVLQCLGKSTTVKMQEDIAMETRISRKTIGQILKELEKFGFAVNPPKKRGTVIATSGRAYLNKLNNKKEQQ